MRYTDEVGTAKHGLAIAAVIVVLSGCGRVGFDARPDGEADAADGDANPVIDANFSVAISTVLF